MIASESNSTVSIVRSVFTDPTMAELERSISINHKCDFNWIEIVWDAMRIMERGSVENGNLKIEWHNNSGRCCHVKIESEHKIKNV